MPDPATQRQLDDIVRDLDLLAFRLEQPAPSPERIDDDRRATRRELERLTQRLRDIADRLA